MLMLGAKYGEPSLALIGKSARFDSNKISHFKPKALIERRAQCIHLGIGRSMGQLNQIY